MAIDFIAGCVGGCAGVIVGYPLDTIKVKLQMQDAQNTRGAWYCMKSILKTEGIKGLFKGITSPLGGVALVNATVFGTYGAIQRKIGGDSPKTHFWAGFCAGAFQSIFTCPVELAKTRLQIQTNKKYSGAFNCFSQILKTDGLRGVFKGFTITALREAPAYGAYFYTYQVLAGDKDTPTWRMMVSGGLAGMISWIVIYPLDVIKTRFQADGLENRRIYTGSMDCLIKSVKGEGCAFLFRGLTPTLIRSFPTNATTFTVFIWTLRLTDLIPGQEPINSHNITWDSNTLHL